MSKQAFESIWNCINAIALNMSQRKSVASNSKTANKPSGCQLEENSSELVLINNILSDLAVMAIFVERELKYPSDDHPSKKIVPVLASYLRCIVHQKSTSNQCDLNSQIADFIEQVATQLTSIDEEFIFDEQWRNPIVTPMTCVDPRLHVVLVFGPVAQTQGEGLNSRTIPSGTGELARTELYGTNRACNILCKEAEQQIERLRTLQEKDAPPCVSQNDTDDPLDVRLAKMLSLTSSPEEEQRLLEEFKKTCIEQPRTYQPTATTPENATSGSAASLQPTTGRAATVSDDTPPESPRSRGN